MNILNNGRFGMAAALSGTMKGLITKAVSSPSSSNLRELYIISPKLKTSQLVYCFQKNRAS